MKYYENLTSRKLFTLNKERINFYNCPRKIKNKTLLYRVWKILSIIRQYVKYLYYSIMGIADKKFYRNTCDYRLCDYYNFKTKPKVCVYTCIIGGYDSLQEPLYVSNDCDYYAITDFELPDNTIWKRINIEKFDSEIKGLDIPRKVRFFKMNPHKLFKEYDMSLWIDGNIILATDIMPVFLEMAANKVFGIHVHPERNTIKSEGKAIVVNKRKANIIKLNAQISKYYSMGYDDAMGLFEATIILRRHNEEKCIELMKVWFEETVNGAERDQISLPFALWKCGFKSTDIYIMGENLDLNPRFIRIRHL